MKSFTLAFIAVVFAAVVVAEEDDILVNSVDNCLEEMKLGDAENIDDEQRFCLNGCLLRKLNLIGDDGKLLANGIDDFFKTVPEEYTQDYPELRSQLTEVAPQLREATSRCIAGKIADPIVGDLFKTDYVE